MMSRTDLAWLSGLLGCVALVLAYSLDLPRLVFTIPFSYQSDALQYLAVFKTILTTGWYTEAPRLGAPFGATHYDAPVPDGLFLLFVLLFRPFTQNPAIPFNVIFVGGFFLVAGCFYAAARSLRIPSAFAAVGALAYAFLPFHFLRLTHLFYTAYFIPPLVVACAVKLAEPSVLERWLDWRKAVLFAATGAAGVYNAVFLAALLAFAAVAGAIAARDRRRIVLGIAAIGLIAGALALNLAPNVLYRMKAGANPEVAKREIGESEVYGLKLAQMVLPHPAHPVTPLGLPARIYSAATFVTENNTAALGMIGTAGFLFCLGWLLLRPSRPLDDRQARIDALAKMNAFLFLLGTVGGLGVLFAVAVSPQIRAWNRVSVVIAAVSLFVLLLALMRWPARASSERLGARRVHVLALALLAIWAVDQAPWRLVQTDWERADHRADAEFIARAAAALPPETMVLQLPYIAYPEAATLHKEGHYGLLRPYVHDSTLRWSYGAMRGRDGDRWLRALAARPLDEQLATAAAKGFGAVYVERRAYPDNGAAVESALAARLGPPILERAGGATALYLLRPER